VASCFHTDERTGRYHQANNRFPQFFLKAPNTEENKGGKREREREKDREGERERQVKNNNKRKNGGKEIKKQTINYDSHR